MTSENNNHKNISNKKQDVDAKENEIEETLENVSDEVVAESKKEANVIGNSDYE